MIVLYNILCKDTLVFLLQVLGEKLCQCVPGNHVLGLTLAGLLLIAAVVEVAVLSIGDDEQLLVLRIGVGLANKLIPLGLAIYHIVVGSLAKVA